jgi:predicted NodU family carbamoyl transferase
MQSLILTLGHNSSAIYIEDGSIIAGIEEERLSKIKSDSNFPINSILKLKQDYDLGSKTDTFISHWFLDGKLPKANKYYDPDVLSYLFGDSERFGLSDKFTHHDAHASSARTFAGPDFPESYHIFVVDGFGTHGECISIYEKKPKEYLNKTHSIHGFKSSIGLFYQYATAFCGMTMHQHEYKMLAYETHITEVIGGNVCYIDQMVDDFVRSQIIKISRDIIGDDIDKLKPTQNWVNKTLQSYLGKLGPGIDFNERNIRILVSYFTQRYAEQMIKWIFNQVKVENLIVVGGVFYNVKLNSMLCDMTPGKFCAMPLAGDQGAGLGVYQYEREDLIWPDHLFWGTRDLSRASNLSGVYEVHKSGVLYGHLRHNLMSKGIVNIVRDELEFGPRSLCATSTLALPTLKNTDIINQMNGRTNEMPMALVVTKAQAKDLFVDIDKVHKSLEYMIVTRKFKSGKHVGLEGGAHYYPLTDEYTCRPQILDEPVIGSLLNEFGPLINTSFNTHGRPIVYDCDDIDLNHACQRGKWPINTIKMVK